MYKHILVPLAFEGKGDGLPSLEVARALAAPEARVTLLHVMEEAPAYAISYLPPDYFDTIREGVIKEMADLAEGLPNCTVEVVSGHAASAILDYAEDNGADCIIIASHRPGLQDWFLGSTASRVVRHAKCGVHVLR
ncbi:MAG: universal stress protein [Rubellimicrobium sp.]|nr:universal stress protein [Rubellimicrobium sp.]